MNTFPVNVLIRRLLRRSTCQHTYQLAKKDKCVDGQLLGHIYLCNFCGQELYVPM
jgi:hypothetical protein